jgi:hypothetical protein
MKLFIAVALALYTGMRQGEIKALHSSSILSFHVMVLSLV